MKYLLSILLTLISLNSSAQNSSQQELDIAAIDMVLDNYHRAAAEADWDSYFDLMSDDGVFLGTDAGERWTKQEFQRYASPTQGWVYTPRERNVTITPDGKSAWFDELLLSLSYGTSRGTGTLIRTAEGWKISQYSLSFPIPNDLSRDVTDQIKLYESQQ